MTPSQIAEAVEERRRELRLSITAFARKADLSKETLAAVRPGSSRGVERPREKTTNGIAVALGWPNDWHERMLRDEWPPTPVKLSDVVDELTRPISTAAAGDDLEELRRLDPEEHAHFEALIRKSVQRARERTK